MVSKRARPSWRLLIDSMGSSLQHSDYLIFPPDTTGRLREYLEHLWAEWRNPSPVARAVGYENVTYFYKIFQRRNGMKPGEFRRQG